MAIETDALVVGAGPVGLFQVFQLGLQEIGAHVVDALPFAGGQCAELYADKPIYDIPGIPVCTGRELTERLLEQIRPLGAHFHLDQAVTRLQRQADGRLQLQTSAGTTFVAKTLFIAAGVGAFLPRRLRIDGLDAYEGTQLHHHVRDPARFAGRHLVLVGGTDAALEWAAHYAEDGPHRAASVTLIHRRDAFNAQRAYVDRMHALVDARRLRFVAGQVVGIEHDGTHLAGVHVMDGDGATHGVPLEHLLVLQGLSPKLGPIADWGLAIERKQLLVDTARFETSEPGIYAVGDVTHYPGKRKLIVCGFHEATLAAFAAAARVHPQRPVQLQYTTTSPRLHQILGVETPAHD